MIMSNGSGSGAQMEIDERNFIGGLDRLTLGVAGGILSVFPTIFELIVRPWRLVPLLEEPEPDGHKGALLSPGVFFVASITVFMLIASWLIPPEAAKYNNSLIGPSLAMDIASAMNEGDIGQVAARIAPIYGLAIGAGVAVMLVARLLLKGWNSYMSLGASFYQMATSISWIIATTALIELAGATIAREAASYLYLFNSVPIFLIPVWQYFAFFRASGDASRGRSLLGAILVILLILIIIYLIQMVGNFVAR